MEEKEGAGKIGSEVSVEDKKGVVVDVSAEKVRINFEDGTWKWVDVKDLDLGEEKTEEISEELELEAPEIGEEEAREV